jgi:hypothetical protein
MGPGYMVVPRRRKKNSRTVCDDGYIILGCVVYNISLLGRVRTINHAAAKRKEMKKKDNKNKLSVK